ncbi:MAG: flagellin FliC [Nitrospinae bacterium]|nr:flagellin FliC [Nitrospinota bacterium]
MASSTSRLSENFAKLASGKRITRAADDAAGLAIAEKLNSDIRSAEQAQRNIGDAAAMTRVAEGGLSEISDMLSRGRELAIQASSGTLNDQQRAAVNNEIEGIKKEIDRISGTTEFNGQKVLDGSMAPGAATQVNVQAGVKSGPGDQINMNVVNQSDTQALGVDAVDVSTQQGAQNALAAFDNAIGKVSETRANIGSLQNRFDSAASNLGVYTENLQAASSNIQDLDYAAGTSELSRNQVLNQAATSLLRQGLSTQQASVGALLNIRG